LNQAITVFGVERLLRDHGRSCFVFLETRRRDTSEGCTYGQQAISPVVWVDAARHRDVAAENIVNASLVLICREAPKRDRARLDRDCGIGAAARDHARTEKRDY